MFYQDFTGWSALNKGLYEPFFDLGKMNSNILERMTRANLSLWSDSIAGCVKYMQTLNKSHRIEDVLKNQMNFLCQQAETGCQYGEEIFGMLRENLHDYRDWTEERVERVFSEEASSRRPRAESRSRRNKEESSSTD